MSSAPQSIFSPASPGGAAISHLFIITLIVCAGVFGVVLTLIVYSLVRCRGREGDADPEQTAGNKTIEIIWTLGPLAILVFLFILTLRAMAVSDPPLKGTPDLEVIGHQWWWEVRYEKAGFVTANEIHIPVDKPISIRVDSADVLHEFWVPRLARKITAVPRRDNHIWIEADHPGVYEGACTEFCGTEHAWMRFQVIAQKPADYAAWVKNQRKPAVKPISGEALQGWRTFNSMTCVACHTIRGTDADGRAGPDLTHFESRAYFAGRVARNTPENLRRWLKNPQQVKPGVKMPNFKLTHPQIDQLIAFFETLK
ncbi:MAG: cytochrome c oxidase subunit II [Opitutaceae bacterium]